MMWKSTRTLTVAGLMTLSATAGMASHEHDAPDGVVEIDAGGVSLTLWPYTSADLENPSDPINLIFPNVDPRAIRQALLKLDGSRQQQPFASLPGGSCTWADAMGYEHAAYGGSEGWVGGAVQLACVAPGAPLGSPFRFHIRLFRDGDHTLGNGHYEILVPGTAEHEVLSWDLARDFVAFDVHRAGVLTAAPSAVGLITPGTFRAVRRPVFQALQAAAGPLLASLGLVLPAAGDVPIPTSGQAKVLATAIAFEPTQSTTTTTTTVNFSIVAPKPFCATGPFDFVKLEGPLHFSMTVHTNPSGRYDRTFLVGGSLVVTPMAPVPTSPPSFVPAGDPIDAIVFESHRGTLTDQKGQVTEQAAQVLLGDPQQSLTWSFAAGHTDRYARQALCGF